MMNMIIQYKEKNMKKKYLIILTLIILLISGCGKKDSKEEIFNISKNRVDCVPVVLHIYSDKTYELFTAFEGCTPGEECDEVIRYTKSETGKYKYKVLNIIENSVNADDKTYTIFDTPLYDIYMSDKYIEKGYAKHYTIEQNTTNEYLDEFLKNTGIDLDKCAVGEYFD